MNCIEYNNNNNNNNSFNNNSYNDTTIVAEDTNFYALPVSKNQYFPIDIGTEDVIDVDSQKSK